MVTGGTQCPAHSLESPFELACDTHRRACTHVQRSRAASRWCAPLYSPSPPLKCRLLARSWGPGTPHPAHPQLRPCRARPSVCGSRAKLFPPRDSRGKTFPIPTVGYCPLGASHRGLGGGQEGALRIPNHDTEPAGNYSLLAPAHKLATLPLCQNNQRAAQTIAAKSAYH